MMRIEISLTVFGCLTLQPEGLKQLSIVHRVLPFIHYMYTKCSYYRQMIIHVVLCLHRGLLNKVQKGFTLPVPLSSVMKKPFRVKKRSMRTTKTCRLLTTCTRSWAAQHASSVGEHRGWKFTQPIHVTALTGLRQVSYLSAGGTSGTAYRCHLFGSTCSLSSMRCHLIMEGAYVTIWTEHFQTSGLAVRV